MLPLLCHFPFRIGYFLGKGYISLLHFVPWGSIFNYRILEQFLHRTVSSLRHPGVKNTWMPVSKDYRGQAPEDASNLTGYEKRDESVSS